MNLHVNKGDYIAVKGTKIGFIHNSSSGDALVFRPPLPTGGSYQTADDETGRLLIQFEYASDHRHEPRPSRGSARTRLSSAGRARRGTSGALYLQSAPAGLNPLPRPAFADADGAIDVEDRVPRSGDA